jgi:cardiolipin synthase
MNGAAWLSSHPWVVLDAAIHLLCFLLVAGHCLVRRRQPNSTFLWLFVVWTIPGLGAFLYLCFGVDRVPDKGANKHESDLKLLAERKALEAAMSASPLAHVHHLRHSARGEPNREHHREFVRAMGAMLPDHYLLGGNRIDPLITGNETFPAMLDAIQGAKQHINLQSFIIGNDRVGREFLSCLADKAASGVKVNILYDRFGSTFAYWGGLFRKYGSIPNMRIEGWTQANPLKRQFQINLRNHRKLLIVDGAHAFCGGINLQSKNLDRNGHEAIRDYHFSVQGPIVHELQYTFIRDWHFITGHHHGDLLTETHFPSLHAPGNAMIRLVNSGPTGEREDLIDALFLSITSATRQILITTPYFVPTPDILRALRAAALRGVDVRLVVPQKNNHVYAGLAGRALYEHLLEAGVRIFERRPPFLHAKAMLIDDAFAIVGTANLDVRSLSLNYETCLLVFDDAFVNSLKRTVLDEILLSDELRLAAWQKRSTSARVTENMCYLLTPML